MVDGRGSRSGQDSLGDGPAVAGPRTSTRGGTATLGLRLRADSTCIGQGEIVLTTGLDGVLRGPDHGLWAFETRVLSRYAWTLDGRAPEPAGAAATDDHRWLGYFIAYPADRAHGQDEAVDPAQQTLELRLERTVTRELGEAIRVTNHTQAAVSARLSLEVDADFIDIREAGGERRQRGVTTREWTVPGRELLIRYRAEHAYDHANGDGRLSGIARIDRRVTLRVDAGRCSVAAREEGVDFDLHLEPHEAWHATITAVPQIEDEAIASAPPAHLPLPPDALDDAAEVVVDEAPALSRVFAEALRQAKHDLAALRILDREGRPTRTFVGGWPTYTAFFGRDALATSWQSSIMTAAMMQGALAALAASQATEREPWRDAEPGRMLHERHAGPLAALRYGPHGRYYGDVTASILYPVVLSSLWRWTGDRALVQPFVKPALDALAWADHAADVDHDGFYEYQTRSEQGEKNQGWKDSSDAIVYPDGSQVEAPLGTCEMQAFVYASKARMAELLFFLGDIARARRLFEEARDLKRRFNDVFWMEDEQYVGLALDRHKRLVRSIASDPGHCLIGGILDDDRVPAVAARLMSAELFSGWGVRTLSARHPAYDPFAYHRGCVWPMENAIFALGFARYGLYEPMHALCKAQIEAAQLFDRCRLPETFGGHDRADAEFPGLYPRADWPQAWSASAVFALLRAMLGVVPYAVLGVLLVDPHLPEWLPTVTLKQLRIGAATVDLRFTRRKDGHTDHEIVAQRGDLHVLRVERAESLTTGWAADVHAAVADLRDDARR